MFNEEKKTKLNILQKISNKDEKKNFYGKH
jgi:hypothetical protein